MEAPFEKNFISTKEAGELSGYTADYLARLARAGSVRSERIGRAWLIDRASLEAFITQQGNRKIDRARALARTREQEYRAAQSPVRNARETVSQISSSVSHRLTKPLSVPELPFAQGALRTHAVALLVALAVVGSGFGVARAATLPQLGAEALALAAETASGFSAAFGNIPAQIAANVTGARGATSAEQIRVRSEIADATAQIPPIAEPHMELALSGMHFGSPASAVQTSAYAFATATPVTFADIASAAASAAAFVSSPTAIGDALLGGYYAAGGAAYEAIRAAQGGYLALIERAGAQALAFGASSRDTLAASPRAISGMNLALGNAVIDGTHAAIGAEVALVYGSVRTAPVVAEASVAFVGGTGTALADAAAGAARGGASATLALLGSAHAAAPALARAVWSTEYAAASGFVSATNAATHAYLALVEGTGTGAYAATRGGLALLSAAQRAAPPIAAASRGFEDWYLGALGKSAVALNDLGVQFAQTKYGAPVAAALDAAGTQLAAAAVVAQPALSLGERAALTTYEAINGWFSSATNGLAILFAPPAQIVMPSAVPQHATSTPRTTVQPSRAVAVTSYPTYTTVVQGVSSQYVDERISALDAALSAQIADMVRPVAQQVATNITTIQQVNMIQHLDDLLLTHPTITDANISGASNFSGNSVTATNASFTNATTTTLVNTGNMTVSGNLTVGGTISPAVVSAGKSVKAPYFIATSSTATSTFAGALAVGTSSAPHNALFQVGTSSPLLHIDSSTGRIGIGTSTPAVALDIYATSAIRLPVGTTAERPAVGGVGYVRYNTTTHQFEGFGDNSVWQGLGGVIDADQNTKITADTNNVDENYLRFFTNGTQNMTLTDKGLLGIGSTSPFAQLGIQLMPYASTTVAFAIGSSTSAYATSTLFKVDNKGNVTEGATNATTTVKGGFAAANSAFNILANGKVGIGTTSPYAQLAVSGSGYFNANVTAQSFVATSSITTPKLTDSGLTAGRVTYAGTGGLLTDSSNFTYDGTTLTLNSNSGTTPTIENPYGGAGLVLAGSSGTYLAQLRIVANANAWADNQETSYFQINSNAPGAEAHNATFMSGQGGSDTQFNRLQFNASSTQITDRGYTGTGVPGALFGLDNSTATKRVMNVLGASGQSADYFDITANGGSNGGIFAVKSSGKVGIGTTTPGDLLDIYGTSVAGDIFIGNRFQGGYNSIYLNGLSGLANYNIASSKTDQTLYINRPSGANINFQNANVTQATFTSGGRFGFGTSSPAVTFDIYASDAMRIPVGTTLERPGGQTGYIRYNTTTHQFEGFGDNSVWQGLGGVIDADQNTKITADTNNIDENYLRFFTNGTQNMTLTDHGLLGIGSTSPFAQLGIQLMPYASTTVAFAIGSSTKAYATTTLFKVDNKGNVSEGATNATTTVRGGFAAAANGFNVLANGNVGIGTTAPGARLQVNSSVNTDTVQIGDDGLFDINRSTGSNAAFINLMSVGHISWQVGIDPSRNNALTFNEGFGGNASSPKTETMRITQAGNVGIGTTSPFAKLSVNGNAFIGGNLTVNGLTATTSISAPYFTATKTTATSTFAGGFQAAGTSGLTVLQNGNVGIGTVSPASKVQIIGDTSNLAVGPVVISANGATNTIGTALTLDSTADSGGKSYSFLSTGPGAVAGAGTFAVYDGSDSTYNFLVNSHGQYIAGVNQYTPAGQITAYPYNSSTVGLAIVGAASQTANYFNVTSNGGTAGNTFAIQSNGNVGIGTTSPFAKLSVNAPAGQASFAIGSTTKTSFIVNKNGNVGIGTTSPFDALSVVGNAIVQGNNAASSLVLQRGNTSGNDTLLFNDQTGAPLLSLYTSGNTGHDYLTSYQSYLDLGTNSGGTALSITTTHQVNATASIIPTANQTYNLGAPADYWDNAYLNNILTNNLSSASTSISGTNQQSFTVFAQNPTADTKDISLIFYRGAGAPSNAVLSWDSTNKRFNLNQNTYIYNPNSGAASTTLAVREAAGQTGPLQTWLDGLGNELARVSSAGHFGIGTTSPSQALSVAGNGLFSGSVTASSFTVGTLSATSSATAPYFTATAANATSTFAGGLTVGTNQFVVQHATGNVGIGTTGPLSKLDVNGGLAVGTYAGTSAAPSNGAIISGNVGIGTTSPFAKLSVNGNAFIGGNLTVNGLTATTSISAPYFTATAANATSTYAGGLTVGTSQLVVQHATGDVGIGTTNPQNPLDIYATGANNGLRIKNTSAGFLNTAAFILDRADQANGYAQMYLKTGGADEWVIGTYAGSKNIRFYNYGLGGTLMTLQDTTGNVGIGTTNPATKLDVLGTASSTNLYTQGSVQFRSLTAGLLYANSVGTLSSVSTSTWRFASSTLLADNNHFTGTNTFTGTATVGNLIDSGLTANSFIYANGSKQLATGSVSAPLSFSAGTLSLGTVGVANGGTNATSQTTNGVTYYNGTSLTTGTGFVYNGTNVGIGTTTPGSFGSFGSGKLTLQTSAGAASPSLVLANTTSASAYDQLLYAGSGRTWTTGVGNASETAYGVANKYFVFDGTAGQMRFVVDTNGSVGIGTTSPTQKLAVQGNAYVSGTSFFGGALTATSTLKFSNYTGILASNGASGVSARTLTGTANQITVTNGDGTAGNPTFSLPAQLSLAHASTTELSVTKKAYFGGTSTTTIDSAGSVVLPAAASLTLGGLTQGSVPYIGAGGVVSQDNANFYYDATHHRLGLGTTSPWANVSINQAAGQTALAVGSSTKTSFVVAANGRLGAGTSTPGVALDLANASGSGVDIWRQTGANYQYATVGYHDIGISGGSNTFLLSTNAPVGGVNSDIELKAGSGTAYLNSSGTLGVGYVNQLVSANTAGVGVVTTGRVGIGTSSPQSMLDIQTGGRNTGNTAYGLRVINTDALSQATNIGFVTGSGTNWLTGTDLYGNNSNNFFIATSTNGYTPATKYGPAATAPFEINSEGTIGFLNFGATPVTTSGRLYEKAGALYFGGTQLTSGTAANYWSRTGTNTYLSNSTDNVGIGTSSPDSLLNLYASTTGSVNLHVQNKGTGTSAYTQIYASNDQGNVISQGIGASNSAFPNEAWIYTSTNVPLLFRTGNSEKMRITSAGNVGIGTSSPTNQLTITHNAANDSGGITLVNQNTSGYGSSLMWTGTYSSKTYSFGSIFAENGGAGGKLFFDTADASQTLQRRMVIDQSGNVGIGSTNPQDALDLGSGTGGRGITWGGASGANRYASIFTAYGDAGLVYASGFNGSTGSDTYLASYTGTYALAGIRTNSYSPNQGSIQFYTSPAAAYTAGAAASPTERMRIDQNGNVGIGTTSPVAKLDMFYNGQTGTGMLAEESSNSTALNNDLAALQLVNYNTTNNAYNTIAFGVTNSHYSAGISGVYTNHYAAGASEGDLAFLTSSQSGGYTEKMRITSAGNVGIGTTGPGAALDVQSTAAGATALFGSTGHSGYIQFRRPSDGATNGYIGYATSDTADGPLLIQDANGGGEVRLDAYSNTGIVTAYSNNTERMRIDASGSVDIGTTASSGFGNLTVQATPSGSSYFWQQAQAVFRDPSALAANNGGGIALSGIYTSGGAEAVGAGLQAYKVNATSGDVNYGLDVWARGGNINFISNTAPGKASNSILTMTSSGNIGIGTTSPANPLTVQSSGNTTPGISVGATTGIATLAPYTLTLGSGYGTTNGASLAVSGGIITLQSNSSTNFNTGGPNTRMTIGSTGNVGIGTTSPASILSVSTNSTVTGTPAQTWAYGNNSANNGLYHLDLVQNVIGAGQAGWSFNNTNNGTLYSNVLSFENGNVGIGTTNPATFKLQVAGNVGPDASNSYNLGASGSNWGCLYYNSGTLGTCASDARLKTDITPLNFGSDPEAAVDGLIPSSFAYKTATSTIYHGLVAQQVLPYAPELVATSSDGYYAVKYGDVQWLMLAAMQEQSAKIAHIQGFTNLMASTKLPEPPATGVAAECVTGDTKLKRRRRNAQGEWEFDEVDIADIAAGDEILSLDEATGRAVYRRVAALLPRGRQEVYELKTRSGRVIRTTINHPYLVRLTDKTL